MRTPFDIGTIIRCHKDEFFRSHKVVPAVRKSFEHIAMCRTSRLGGHVEVCPECGDVHISYNSCRDRHCPKCQNSKREEWIHARKEEIIPAKYFHVVFTVPACLQQIAMQNQSDFYDSLFKSAWLTLKAFADDEGLMPGMTSILHTWGSNLFYHPHIHCIVPGGGVDCDGKWHFFKGCKRRDFLFSVIAMSEVFRGKFLSHLTSRLKEKNIIIPQKVRSECMKKRWVVYSRPPAKGVDQVLEYIGRYAYRLAISNSRIKNFENGNVTYDYKYYRNGGKHGTNTVSALKFLNLLSQHILPDHFVKVRHYGILSPAGRERLRKVQCQLHVKPVPKVRKKKGYLQICEEHGWKSGYCEHCNCQRTIVQVIAPALRAPPFEIGIMGK